MTSSHRIKDPTGRLSKKKLLSKWLELFTLLMLKSCLEIWNDEYALVLASLSDLVLSLECVQGMVCIFKKNKSPNNIPLLNQLTG